MRVTYHQECTPDGVIGWLSSQQFKTMLFDVEPLVAYWNSGSDTLAHGVRSLLAHVPAWPEVAVVGFATNSRRRLPSEIIETSGVAPGVQAFYLAAAGKPLRTDRYRNLPRPGVVVGDQVPTDGVLARRLGFTFLHYRPVHHAIPIGPRMMGLLGQLLRRHLFATGV